MRRVFVTGASGLLGARIVAQLAARGDEIRALSRAPRADAGGVRWIVGDLMAPQDWGPAMTRCDAVIHLAGESIGDHRWNEARRARIVDSRVLGTRAVVGALAAIAASERPKVLVVANGVDVYAFDDSDRAFDEGGAPGQGFLAELCAAWQTEAEAARPLGVRVATLRTGVVLAHDGGAFPRLVGPFKAFVGGRVGSGRQWFSWVHADDAAAAYLHAVDHDALAGPVNVVAPDAVRQAAFAKALGRALHRPSWLGVPGFALKAAAGGLAEYLVHGRRVVPRALLESGFRFHHPELAAALAKLVEPVRGATAGR